MPKLWQPEIHAGWRSLSQLKIASLWCIEFKCVGKPWKKSLYIINVLQSIQTHLPHSFTLPSWSQDPPRLHTVLPVWLQRYHPPAIEELSKRTSRFQMGALTLPWCSTICTLKKLHRTQNWWFVNCTHFSKRQYFQVPALCFCGCTQQNMDKYPKNSIRFLGIQGFPIPSSE